MTGKFSYEASKKQIQEIERQAFECRENEDSFHLIKEKINHLNLVFHTIHKVNQMIVKEKDKKGLIQKACELLVKNRGYKNAWGVLIDEQGGYIASMEAGLGNRFALMQKMLGKGIFPNCINKTLGKKKMVILEDPASECSNCPFSEKYAGWGAYSTRLAHEGKSYGLLTASIPGHLITDKKEQDLFREIGNDIGFALYSIELEKQRGKIEKEKQALESQLRQAQKMESVGRLAGGVAHDYNNALSVITGFTEIVMADMDPEGQPYKDLNEVLSAARKAADITRQLLAFARKQTIAPRVLDLNKSIAVMLKMLRRLIGEDIDLAWLPGGDIWPVRIDPSQIDQILANLCVNARDAIAGVGKVTIETTTRILDQAYCDGHAGFIPGEFVLMAVSDNGCGMDKAILDIIFEPFFTTKDVDKGTGLGLSTVYGIVKQNKGFINVYSEPGKGTSIKIYLPRHEGESEDIPKKFRGKISLGCGETILVVEDDLSILKLVRKILEGLNYKVFAVGTPAEAMDLTREHNRQIHLLVTDVIMPEMNGRDLAEYLKAFNPGLSCMFMSGYTANAIAHHGVLDEGVFFLQKPFSRKDLAEMVRKALKG